MDNSTQQQLEFEQLNDDLRLYVITQDGRTVYALRRKFNDEQYVQFLKVTCVWPSIRRPTYYSHHDPAVPGNIGISMPSGSSYGGIADLHADVADVLAKLLVRAAEELREREEKNQVAAKKAREQQHQLQQEEQERRLKEQEYQKKVAAIIDAYNAEMFEFFKWHEGENGRVKVTWRSGWMRATPIRDVYETGMRISRPNSSWGESVQFKDLLAFEIKPEGEPRYTKMDLPAYPDEELQKLAEENDRNYYPRRTT